jgi:hypothetical protein
MRPLLVVALALACFGCFDFEKKIAVRCGEGLVGCPDDDGGSRGDSGVAADSGAGSDAGEREENDGGARDGDAGSGDSALCIGTDGWCWETNAPIPGNVLTAVWGTSDSDVWIGGAGATLVHWDGHQWTNERGALLPISGALTDNEPQIVAAAQMSTGEAWIAARPQSFRIAIDGTKTAHARDEHLTYARARGSRAWFMDSAGKIWDAKSGDLACNLSGRGYTAQGFLPISETDFVVSMKDWFTADLIQYLARCDGVLRPLRNADSSNYTGNVFTLHGWPDGGYLAGGSQGDVFESSNGAEWTRRSVSNDSSFTTTNIDTLPNGEVVLMGLDGTIINRTTGVERMATRAALNSSWTSPEGTLWVVGAAGTVLKRDSANAAWSSPWPRRDPAPSLQGLFIDDQHQVAVGSGGALQIRDGGQWFAQTVAAAAPGDLTSVWVSPSGVIVLGSSTGQIWRNHTKSPTPLQSSTPVMIWGVDDERFFATNSTDVRLFTRTTSLPIAKLETDGALVALAGRNQHELFIAESVLPWEPDAGRNRVWGLKEDGDGGWSRESWMLPESPSDLSVTPNDVWVSGPNSMVGRLTADGGFVSEWPDSSNYPLGVTFTSVWADPMNPSQVWVLTSEGAVLRRSAPGTWERESIGLGTSVYTSAQAANRIRGNAASIFVIGEWGAILRRPR